MGSIGSMTKPELGFLAAAVQYPVPIVNSRADIDKQIENIVRIIHHTKAGYPGLELIIFPEYSTQGLNTEKWLTEEFLLDVPGKETDIFAQACKEAGVYGVFSIIERNPDPTKNPYDTAIIINPEGEICLKYRKLFPWTPIEPWSPGNLGMPVCDGPGGSKLAVCICHDGMIPEVAREAAYKGANVYIRISGYSTQVQDQWILTNRSNAWHNLMYTISVNCAGYDGTFYYFGEGQICNFDGTVLQQGTRSPGEIVTGEIYPILADGARRTWGLENNIYNLGSRAYVGDPGGDPETELTYIHDLANGKYKLPWDDDIKIKDGSIYGYSEKGKKHWEE
ncbi:MULTISPECIES: formamidase [Ignatzschineria]|uniref:Formamidase n=1 Tax=Ignatzschineria cameli TaxID=2182793 RepID=A0A2U2AKA6_9GAMM|nr:MULTISPECIES: formamidase [Ignatzschineria]OYQ80488.1 formamidase [Ignatzschineria sp. F8392]PWD82852.1 formamidase [Ignatzschineria cameli]PWD83264.1 formamidase [Ignatzschineria cameli]PWD87682.1 formamidase [Ignatzschineria cameli]PWD88684.1 formamidase [Ignatzschineria cameli]